MRLIDADALVDMLYENEYSILCPLDEVSGVIDCCPTVDAEPVRNGHWIDKGEITPLEIHRYECSTCKKSKLIFSHRPYKYCPNCGAKMDEEVQ